MKNKPFILGTLSIIISMAAILPAKAQDTTNRFERTLPNTPLSKPTDTAIGTQQPVNLNPPNTPATLQGNNSTPGNPQPATPIYNNPNNSPAINTPPPHSSAPF